jgi:hypothetical protein
MGINKDIIEAELRTSGGSKVRSEMADISKQIRKLKGDNDSLKVSKAKLEAQGKRNSKEWKQLNDQIKANNKQITTAKGKYKQLNAQLDITEKSATELKKESRQLRRELNATSKAAEPKRWKQLNSQLEKTEKQYKKVRAGTNRTGKAMNTLKSLLPVAGIGALVTGVVTLGKKFINLQEELRKTRHQIQTLTGATGSMLDELTAKVDATAKTFDKDFGDVATAANSLAKQMNISFGQAMELIQDGFAAGADNSGEFLSMLKEYPTQLKQVGVSADQAVALMTQQVKEGVFSDKGIDAIKEAGIRLREMTKPTQEAIEGIGLTVDQVQKVIGEEGIIGGIKLISKQLNQLEDDSPEVGAALADIFAGPGEDAGLQYLKTLKDIDATLGDVSESTDEYAQQQKQLLEANERVSHSMNALMGNGNVFTQMWIQLKSKLANFLETLRSVPLFMNKVGRGINNLLGKDLFNVKNIKEYQGVLFQVNPTFRELSDKVKKFGVETIKGKQAMDELAKALVKTYGEEGSELAISFMEQQAEVRKEFVKNTQTTKKGNKEKTASFKELNEALEKAHEQRKLNLQEQYAAEKLSTEQFHTEMLLEEQAYLQSKRALQQQYSENTIATSQKIAKNERKIAQLNKSAFEMQQADMNEFLDQVNQDYIEQMEWLETRDNEAKNKLTKNYEQWSQKMDQLEKQRNNRARKNLEQKLQTTQQVAGQMGQILGQAVADGNVTLEEAGKQMLVILLDQLRQYLRIQIAKATIGSLASAESIATFGAAGAAKAAILTGLMEAAFAGVKSIVLNSGDSSSSSRKVPQRAAGTLDVIGEDDGKVYNNVPYKGSQTGVGVINQGRPTLINEHGGELFADAATTRNIQMNAPELIDAIKAHQVPQRADGNVPERTGSGGITEEIRKSRETNKMLAATLNRLLDEPIRAVYDDDEVRNIRERSVEFDKIERDASWG